MGGFLLRNARRDFHDRRASELLAKPTAGGARSKVAFLRNPRPEGLSDECPPRKISSALGSRAVVGYSADMAAAITMGPATSAKVPISTTYSIGGAVSEVRDTCGWHANPLDLGAKKLLLLGTGGSGCCRDRRGGTPSLASEFNHLFTSHPAIRFTVC